MAANRTMAAAGLILFYGFVIGYTDNYVRVIAAEAGLAQFHAMRSAMALALVAVAALPLGLTLRPRRWRGVAARSLIHAAAMALYFGSLGFLPVPQVAAGLFTAPIFVLLIGHFGFGQRIGPYRIAAVAAGFLGVLLVLGPGSAEGLSLVALFPVASGALYALGNIATREWCEGESPIVLTGGFFLALGIAGLLAMGALAVFPLKAPDGPEGFPWRGPVWPSGTFLWWTFVQAAGSLLGVAAMIRGYQLTEASRAAVFEYSVLPIAAFWGWALWSEVPSALAWWGMALIAASGAVIALRGK
jgi:drug/metabolite transporter (DMT)-like permease